MQHIDDTDWEKARDKLHQAYRDRYGDEGFNEYEAHLRFGHTAARQSEQERWDEGVETQLRNAWPGNWTTDKGYIRRGWELTRTATYSARPPLVAKPLSSLPETPKSQPAVTNHTPDTTHRS